MSFITKGRDAAKKELEHNKQRQEAAQMKQLILKEGEESKIVFLEDEPVGVYIHKIQKKAKKSGKLYWAWVICTADPNDPNARCELCEAGHKPTYQNAYPVVDRRNFEVIKDRQGKFKEVKVTMTKRGGTFCVVMIGQNTIPVFERAYEKNAANFKKITWDYYRVGEGTATTYHIDKSNTPLLKKFGESKEEKEILKQLKAFSWESFFAKPPISELKQIMSINGLIAEGVASDDDGDADFDGEDEDSDVKF